MLNYYCSAVSRKSVPLNIIILHNFDITGPLVKHYDLVTAILVTENVWQGPWLNQLICRMMWRNDNVMDLITYCNFDTHISASILFQTEVAHWHCTHAIQMALQCGTVPETSESESKIVTLISAEYTVYTFYIQYTVYVQHTFTC